MSALILGINYSCIIVCCSHEYLLFMVVHARDCLTCHCSWIHTCIAVLFVAWFILFFLKSLIVHVFVMHLAFLLYFHPFCQSHAVLLQMPYMCHSESCTNPSYICDCFHNCSVASFPGGIGFAVTSLLMQKASGTIRWGGGTIALATWQMNWWPPTLRMETHRPFLLFDLLNFDLHYRCQAGRQGGVFSSSLLPRSHGP